MMNAAWAEILEHYNKAKSALWCPKGSGHWRRDDDAGHYHMWRAYHQACETEPKDDLVFARILAMMADKCRILDYERYHKYVKPSVEAYERAIQNGQAPTEKELEKIRRAADALAYVLGRENAPYDEQLKCIDGHEKLEGFGFHDSKPIGFEHTDTTARLKLNDGDVTVTLLFEGLLNVHVDGDPVTNWIMDFYCYPYYYNKNMFVFDVGYYRIICEKVSVESVDRAKARDDSARR